MSVKTYMAAAALGLFGSAMIQTVGAKDITIFDNVRGNTWGSDARGIEEDQEIEPGAVQGQQWDLEAFHLNGTTLSMVGGFDFINGEDTFASGDIFIDVNGDAVWGTPASSGGTVIENNSAFHYDYVVAFGGRTLTSGLDSDDQTLDGTYKVYSLTGASEVTVRYDVTKASNPWIYNDGGTLVQEGNVTQTAYTGGEYAGATHYELGGIDLSFLGSDLQGALFKFTMECGNDNLVGRTPVPDGGLTAALLGIGLFGLSRIRLKLDA